MISVSGEFCNTNHKKERLYLILTGCIEVGKIKSSLGKNKLS